MGVFSILLPLSTLLVVSCINGPSEEECAKAEQQIEAAHKAKDYQRLMLLADSLEKDNPKLLQKTRLYDNKEYVAAQMRANNLADRRWNEMLDQQDAGIAGNFTALDCDDSSWAVIDQNQWGWRGTGSTWLRQHIQIDKAHAGKPARLLLGTLFDADITYVNGQQVGRTY